MFEMQHRAPYRKRTATLLTCLALAAGLAGGALPVAAQDGSAAPAECPWMDTSLSADERARLLLDASTLDQKMRWLNEWSATQPGVTEWEVGGSEEEPGEIVTYAEQVPCTPAITFVNGPQGVNASPFGPPVTTAFATPIAEAAAWDPEISFAKGAMMAAESYGAGRNVLLGPGLAGHRVPYLGRTSEYYSEDPVLAGALAAQSVLGLEEGVEGNPVVANLKHYVANEQELDRESSSSNIDERTRRQIYDLSYEIAIRESDPGSLMCAYNQVDGMWACENPILTEVLKDEIGFAGFVMSDFGAVHSTAASLDAGLDLELNAPVWFAPELLHAALEAGEITEDRIDEAAFRVVRAFIDVGLFDNPLPEIDPDAPPEDLRTPESLALALRMAEEGAVLLKNEGLLPLADDPEATIAVLGVIGSDEAVNVGTDEEPNEISAHDVCTGWLPFGPGFPAVPCHDPVSPLEGIEARSSGTVVFDNGLDPDAAAAVAAEADVAVVVAGYRMGETEDLEDLGVDWGGEELIAAVAAANPNTVVVLQAGSAVTMPWIDDVPAVLDMWYPGSEMGTAIANLLFGDVNPSGKLPLSFPASEDDLPTAASEAQYPGIPDEAGIRQVDFSEGMAVGYRWYQQEGIEPLFPFGHGLSYTTFAYGDLSVAGATDGVGDIQIDFTVTNSGDVDGTEIAQVYVQLPEVAGEPWGRLVDWAKVDVAAGETAQVSVTLSAQELADRHLLQYWDVESDSWVTPAGTYAVRVGGSSADLPLEGELAIG